MRTIAQTTHHTNTQTHTHTHTHTYVLYANKYEKALVCTRMNAHTPASTLCKHLHTCTNC